MGQPPRQWRHQWNLALQRVGMTPKQASAMAVLLLTAWTLLVRIYRRQPTPPLVISLSAALRLLREKSVQQLSYTDGGSIFIRLTDEKALSGEIIRSGKVFATQLVPGSASSVFKLADETGVPFRFVAPSRGLSQVFSAILPLVFVFVWYKAAKSLISNNKDEKYVSPRKNQRPRERTTFGDVVSKSTVELAEIVDYLNQPQKYLAAGARLPRGALLVGPSGTGKTLLARAVAGEANCTFLCSSASEFVEVYVGRGAARVRDLFKQARDIAPCVLFIDELDALGSRTRTGDARGANEEYVQTLNQLLTELDGFHSRNDGVVVLAATNRHESIDSALLRPGRFDRHVFVELPDEEERLEILQIHCRKAALTADVDISVLESLSESSAGFSGAELANVVNEAVFLALRGKRPAASAEDFLAALDRQLATRQRSANANAASGGVPMSGFPQGFFRAWPAAAAAR